MSALFAKRIRRSRQVAILALLGLAAADLAWLTGGAHPLPQGLLVLVAAWLGALALDFFGALLLQGLALLLLYTLPLLASQAGWAVPPRGAETLYWALVLVPAGLLGSWFLELARHERAGLYQRLRLRVRENWRLAKVNGALVEVQQELEERLGRQSDAMVLLHAQLGRLERSDLSGALEVLLDTVGLYSRCSLAGIWSWDRQGNRLILEAGMGDSDGSLLPAVLDPRSCPQGWALRHNRMYSIRQLREYPHLLEADDGSTIMALPLRADGQPWAVLAILDMPFARYNAHSEQLLQIVVRLMEGEIERILDFERRLAQDERDPVSGLPLYGMLVRSLEDDLEHARAGGAPFSLVLAEGRHLDGGITMASLLPLMQSELPAGTRIFHYKSPDRLALVFPNLDYDGTALVCLHLLRRASEEDWPAELVYGYSAWQAGSTGDAGSLLNQAEHLLEIQSL